MKYAILIIILLFIAIFLPIIILQIIEKFRNKKIKFWIKITTTIISFLLIMTFAICSYLGIFYHATSDALDSLKSDIQVEVIETNDYYFFDNKENDQTAIIFYPGAKVEETAYAPLAKEIAKDGFDIYIIKMPFHFALLDTNKADIVMEKTNYKDVYLMGHSLGGTTLSIYLSTTTYNYKGIIFLASYPSKKINNNLSSLSIYGSFDQVLNKEEYEKNKELLPQINYEVIIDGGNHGYFGNYGEQKGDGIATIDRAIQQQKTKEAIVNFIEK